MKRHCLGARGWQPGILLKERHHVRASCSEVVGDVPWRRMPTFTWNEDIKPFPKNAGESWEACLLVS